MKIIYCINSLKNPGGMERVLVNKANYFSEKFGYEIYIITTDQNENKSFYKLNENIKCIDLNINYSEDFNKGILSRIIPYLKKQKIHKNKLKNIIQEIKPDFIISTGCEDTYFLPKMNDMSKKIREYHFGKNYRKEYVKSFKKNIIYKIKAQLDTFREELISRKYSKVVLLTEEDRKNWKNKNLEVIYNSLSTLSKEISKCENKKVISVGRLDGQKGYDRLIEAWKIVNKIEKEWVLEIYGDGIDRKKLENQIEKLKLKDSIFLMGKTDKIEQKYLESSIYVMSSRYEGFGMVLVEAMNCGLPVISFKCPSGPTDIIKNKEDGYLIENGNIKQMAEKIIKLTNNNNLRKQMGIEAKKNVQRFSQETIMLQWKQLFENLK